MTMTPELNFLITAGYDFRGANKSDIPLGIDVSTETTFVYVAPDGIC